MEDVHATSDCYVNDLAVNAMGGIRVWWPHDPKTQHQVESVRLQGETLKNWLENDSNTPDGRLVFKMLVGYLKGPNKSLESSWCDQTVRCSRTHLSKFMRLPLQAIARLGPGSPWAMPFETSKTSNGSKQEIYSYGFGMEGLSLIWSYDASDRITRAFLVCDNYPAHPSQYLDEILPVVMNIVHLRVAIPAFLIATARENMERRTQKLKLRQIHSDQDIRGRYVDGSHTPLGREEFRMLLIEHLGRKATIKELQKLIANTLERCCVPKHQPGSFGIPKLPADSSFVAECEYWESWLRDQSEELDRFIDHDAQFFRRDRFAIVKGPSYTGILASRL